MEFLAAVVMINTSNQYRRRGDQGSDVGVSMGSVGGAKGREEAKPEKEKGRKRRKGRVGRKGAGGWRAFFPWAVLDQTGLSIFSGGSSCPGPHWWKVGLSQFLRRGLPGVVISRRFCLCCIMGSHGPLTIGGHVFSPEQRAQRETVQ